MLSTIMGLQRICVWIVCNAYRFGYMWYLVVCHLSIHNPQPFINKKKSKKKNYFLTICSLYSAVLQLFFYTFKRWVDVVAKTNTHTQIHIPYPRIRICECMRVYCLSKRNGFTRDQKKITSIFVCDFVDEFSFLLKQQKIMRQHR